MTDRYDNVSTTRFTLTALSLLLIVLSVLVPVFATSTPAALATPTDRVADVQFDTLELLDNLALPANTIHVAGLTAVSSLNFAVVIEWAWYLRPPVRPPSFSH
jgi:hypothetical protein